MGKFKEKLLNSYVDIDYIEYCEETLYEYCCSIASDIILDYNYDRFEVEMVRTIAYYLSDGIISLETAAYLQANQFWIDHKDYIIKDAFKLRGN